MSSILTRDRTETRGESTEDTVREPLKRTVLELIERAETSRSNGSFGRGTVRPFVLVDLGPVVEQLFGDGGAMSEGVEARAESALDSAKTEMRSGSQSATDRGRRGRGTLSRLFLLGLVAGLGYVLRRRGGSVGRVLDKATERASSVAEEAADRSGEAADRTETVSGEAAERVQETGDMAAERMQEGSEMAAERIEETGETASDRIEEGGQTAADRVDETADTAEEAEQATDETSGADEGDEETEE